MIQMDYVERVNMVHMDDVDGGLVVCDPVGLDTMMDDIESDG